MTNDEKTGLEMELVKVILTFHDCVDEEKRERYVREYFLEFCDKHKLDKEEMLNLIEDTLNFKRQNTMYKYEHFTDLKSIIYPNKEEKDDEGR